LAGESYTSVGEPTCSIRPLVEHGNSIRDVERLRLVVGDEHRGDMYLVVKASQPGTEIIADLRIQRTEWLVQQ
jgi:hypothetical protein